MLMIAHMRPKRTKHVCPGRDQLEEMRLMNILFSGLAMPLGCQFPIQQFPITLQGHFITSSL